VRVTTSPGEKLRLDARLARQQRELEELHAANPRPVLWKKIKTEGFGAGRNLRFGELDGDGHPDMCNAVLDITGDCRDEVVVWKPQEIWVYTQPDSPKAGRLYRPRRNPLYNYSNYQATISLPGWSQ